MFPNKVVLGKSVAEVAQNVIKYVRLQLLTPEELKQVELDNEKDRMIPVSPSTNITVLQQLTLNGHLCKMDTSIRQTTGVLCFSVLLVLTPYKMDTSLRWTVNACPGGVHLGES